MNMPHQKIIATFWAFEHAKTDKILRGGNFLKIEYEQLSNYAFPKVIDIYLKEKVLTLF